MEMDVERELDKTGALCEVPGCGRVRLVGEARCIEHPYGTPAVWIPLDEPTTARMLRFEHDGSVVDLGTVTVEPFEPETIELAPADPAASRSWVDKAAELHRERELYQAAIVTAEQLRAGMLEAEQQQPVVSQPLGDVQAIDHGDMIELRDGANPLAFVHPGDWRGLLDEEGQP